MNKKLSYAHPLHRLLAGLIDTLVSWSFVSVGLLVIASTSQLVDLVPSIMNALLLLFVSPVITLILTPVLMSKAGGSLGKLASGISVVNEKGEFLSFWQAFFRNTVGYMVSSGLFGLGFIWIFVSKERQGWHDMISSDMVVVKQATGLVTGIVVLLVVLGVNVWILRSAVAGFTEHAPLYDTVFTQLEQSVSEMEKKGMESSKSDSTMPLQDTPIEQEEVLR